MKKLFWPLALAFLLCLFLARSSQGVGNDNPTGVTGEYNGSITTGGSYDPYTGNAKRFVDDLTVTGSIGAYPLKWTRVLNTRGQSGPFGDGGGWRHNYQWALWTKPIFPPPNPCAPPSPDGIVYYPDGRKMNLLREIDQNQVETWTQADGLEPMDRLVHRGGTNYDLKLNDGGRVEFRTVNGLLRAAERIVDPYGQTTTLGYDSSYSPARLHLRKITEPAGRYIQITYKTFAALDPYPEVKVIDYVETFDGPQAHVIEKIRYEYEAVVVESYVSVRFYNLVQAIYDDGPPATYTYLDPALVTPGNQTTMAAGNVETCDDVRYAGAMSKIRYEYVPAGWATCGMAGRGQVKAERNMTAPNTVVSSVDHPSSPSCNYPALSWRTETRADGATRRFYYGGVELGSYTDFAYSGEPQHSTIIGHTMYAPGNSNHYLRTVTDARGYATSTEKERNIGAVMAVIHPNQSRMTYAYSDTDNPYYLTSRTDENDKITHYDRYDANVPSNPNRVWQIRYPDGGSEEFTYNNNPFGLVYEHRMTSGGTEVFEYDNRGLKTSYTPPVTPSDPEQHKTLYFYYGGPIGPGEAPEAPVRPDLMDRLRRVIDPRGYSTWYEYNARGQVTKVTHPDSNFTQSFYNPDGTLQWAEDELGHRTTYLYDEYKRVTKVTNHLNEHTDTSYAPRMATAPFRIRPHRFTVSPRIWRR